VYTPNFIEIGQTFCGRTDVPYLLIDGHFPSNVIRSTRRSRANKYKHKRVSQLTSERWHCSNVCLVSWSLTSLFSTNMAISETNMPSSGGETLKSAIFGTSEVRDLDLDLESGHTAYRHASLTNMAISAQIWLYQRRICLVATNLLSIFSQLQCFDTVGWASRRVSTCRKLSDEVLVKLSGNGLLLGWPLSFPTETHHSVLWRCWDDNMRRLFNESFPQLLVLEPRTSEQNLSG